MCSSAIEPTGATGAIGAKPGAVSPGRKAGLGGPDKRLVVGASNARASAWSRAQACPLAPWAQKPYPPAHKRQPAGGRVAWGHGAATGYGTGAGGGAGTAKAMVLTNADTGAVSNKTGRSALQAPQAVRRQTTC